MAAVQGLRSKAAIPDTTQWLPSPYSGIYSSMRQLRPILIIALGISTVVSGWLLWVTSTDLERLRQEVRYPFDAPFENAAYEEAARHEAQPIAKMRQYFIPITMTYPDKKCVELRPRWNVYGGHTIYCFDPKVPKLLYNVIVPG